MHQILQKFDGHWRDGGPSLTMMYHLRRVSDLLCNWNSCLLCYMKDVVLHCSIFFKWNKLVRVRVRVLPHWRPFPGRPVGSLVRRWLGLRSCAADVPLRGLIAVVWRGHVIVHQAWRWRQRLGLFLLPVQHRGCSGMMMMMRSFLTCQQVSQCVWPFQGPFLDGKLLRLLSSWHAGGVDDDDTVRLGARQMMRRARRGSVRRLMTGGTEGCDARRCPFYLCRRRFSCWSKEPTLPKIEARALKSPMKPLSISKSFLPHWLTVHCRRALRASASLDKRCFWWGCRVMFPLRMLAAHSERVLIRSLSAPATSCLTTLTRMHMASACLRRLQGIMPRGRGQTRGRCRFLAVAAAVVAAVLLWIPLLRPATTAGGLPGQFPVSRLHMTVKDQDASGCPGHDPREQCHKLSGQRGLAISRTAGE